MRGSFRCMIHPLACLAILSGFCLFGFHQSQAEEKEHNKSADVFVRGEYAYVVHGAPSLDGTITVLHLDSETSFGHCARIDLYTANLVFVAENYLYVVSDQRNALIKYDISDPCSPESLGFWYMTNGGSESDLYITGDAAYVSTDPSGVDSIDIADTLLFGVHWDAGDGSPQGLHVRGGYCYVGNEHEQLWVRNMATGENYKVGIANPGDYNSGRDVYNVGFRKDDGSPVSVTYNSLDSGLKAWDTTDPENISELGELSGGGPVVHVNGDWVYQLGSSVKVCSLQYSAPARHTSLDFPSGIEILDIHIVHTGYWGQGNPPAYGSAHIFGVWIDTSADPDTAALYVWNPDTSTVPVKGYKYGDVDDDGDVDFSDALKLNYYTVRGYNWVLESLDAADVNCDGEVNTYDADYLFEYLFNGGDVPGAECDFYDDW